MTLRIFPDLAQANVKLKSRTRPRRGHHPEAGEATPQIFRGDARLVALAGGAEPAAEIDGAVDVRRSARGYSDREATFRRLGCAGEGRSRAPEAAS